MLGAGSQEILKSAMRAWVTPTRAPGHGAPDVRELHRLRQAPQAAGHRGEGGLGDAPRRRGDDRGGVDGDAGLVFFNNPNNPTATVHGAKTVTDMVERIRKASPHTVILIDEAYHEYVTDPSYQTAVPLALVDAERLRRAHVLEGVRDGRHAHRLRDRHARDDEEARGS